MSVENRVQETVKDVWFNLLAWATHQYMIKRVIDVVIEPNGTIFAPGDLNYQTPSVNQAALSQDA